jgi:hypothetical protein
VSELDLEDFILAAIWGAVGLVGAFALYAMWSPRIQRPQLQQPGQRKVAA